MEFSELKNTYGAFDTYITVKRAKELGVIPKKYAELFPDRCKCGSENIITGSLTHAMCCNPRCVYKLGYALSELFTRFDIKGLGDAICAQMISSVYDKLKYKSHVEIIGMEPNEYPYAVISTVKGQEMYQACKQIRKRSLTFTDLVSMIGIPQFSTSSGKLLTGIHSLKHLCDLAAREGGIKNFCANRGVYDSMKVFWFYQSIPDIFVAEQVFGDNMRLEGLVKVKICITGSITIDGTRVTRNKFVELCNKVGCKDGRQIVEVQNTSAKESCQYVIADYESNTAKYLAGKERGVLITSKEFIDKIKEVCNDGYTG